MNVQILRCSLAVALLFTVVVGLGAQEGPIREAVELNEQIIKLYVEGHYSKAIPLAQRMLAICEKSLGPEHPTTATALLTLGKLYGEIGAYTTAEPLLKRALAIREKVSGPEHLRTAIVLGALGSLHHNRGNYREAAPLLQRSLAIHEKVLGREHPDTATATNDLAQLYSHMGVNSEAEQLLRRAVAIYEETVGPEHPDLATALANLGALYRARGANLDAEPLLKRALAIHQKALRPEHPDIANSLSSLAELYHDMGTYDKAEPLYQRALAIRENSFGPEHPDTAAALNNLAALHRSAGAYAKAEPLLQRALAIQEKVFGLEHLETAQFVNNLGVLYVASGNYEKAEQLYQRAFQIREKALGIENPSTAASINNLGALYREMGDYVKSEQLLQQSLDIRERVLGLKHLDTAFSLNSLANLYQATGVYSKAEPLYHRALAIRENAVDPNHPEIAQSLNNLASMYLEMGAYLQAEPLFKRALRIHETALGPNHPNTATSVNNLAGLYKTRGDYSEAQPLYQRALAIRQETLGPEHPDIALALNNLAALYHASGAYTKSDALFLQALTIREKTLSPEHPDVAVSLTNLAISKWAFNEPAKALSLLRRAQSIDENNLRRFLLYGSEARKQGYLQQLRGNTFMNISFSLAVADQQAVALGLASILQYKGRVLEAMSDSVARLRQSVSPEDSKMFEEFANVVQQESVLTFQDAGNLQPEAYRTLDKLLAKKESLETELAKRSAAFRQQVTPITVSGVQQVIPRNAVLLEWFRYAPFDRKASEEGTRWGKPRYVVYVLKREGEAVVVDVGEAEPIETLLQNFRKALSDQKSAFVKEISKQLSEKLLEPLRSQLGNTERLLISPDGALNLLTFAALLDGKGEYLAKDIEITYLTSGRDLLHLGSELSSRNSAVVVADPDFGKSANMRSDLVFPSLQGTTEEAETLKALLHAKDENVLTGANATEAKLKQLRGPRILHIATHGFFLRDKEIAAAALSPKDFKRDQRRIPVEENPLLRSGLALAGANLRHSGENDDGILTAAEAAHLDLRGTRLVVLSACETGVGEVLNGEGVYGLRRALVLAGSETQVTSLWKVADPVTKDLMQDYYKRLLKGEGRSAALRDAQRTMINSQERSHPYFWAAFVLIGNWAPLPPER